MTVAALYVDPNGVYAGLPDVEVWDESRDARLYDGPYPVVAHPPCARWSVMGNCNPAIAHLIGRDDGCFAAALAAVRRFGGVLEHPAYTRAWSEYGLARPARFGWTGSLTDDGWTAQVDQSNYGHVARKLTWLYYVGPDPPPLLWGDAGRHSRNVRNLGDRLRIATPPLFAGELLAMARLTA